MRYDALPPEVRHAFKRALLDFLTCAVAGSAMPVSRALLSYYEENDATRSVAFRRIESYSGFFTVEFREGVASAPVHRQNRRVRAGSLGAGRPFR